MKKKFKLDLKGFFNKKENVAVAALALVFCAGLVVTEVKANNIPLHDGDVLVDSRNIAQVEEDSNSESSTDGDSEKTEKTAGDDVNKEDGEGDAATNGNTFAEKRAKLDLERNDLIAGYDSTIKNSTNDAEKNNAVANKEKLTKYMEQEVSIESLISSKNLPECLVIITESTITVTVDEQELTQNTVAKICNIVMAETGRGADKIIIQSNY